MVLRESALAHNLQLMSAFCRGHGVELMPHGKTTMAPQLWRRQLEAGATGTLADTVQARVMAAAGVPMILIANEVTDEAGLRGSRTSCATRLHLSCVASTYDGVRLAAAALRGAPRPLPVLAELGHPGGRAGCRTIDEALMVAELVLFTRSSSLRARPGTRGRSPGPRARRVWPRSARTEDLASLCRELASRQAIETEDTSRAGGSSFFDVVAEVLAEDASPIGSCSGRGAT